ncbi:MAG: response regulator [Candidatus Sungbacteria bacterium]|nr:response regulator [Candidatus Sungbacteria bacterium]
MEKSTPKKILIIDDDPFIADMYVIKFKGEGFEVEAANDGKVGIEQAAKMKPDVILLDVVMPTMDGFDVLQKLRADKSLGHTKIIFLTNFGQREDIERGMQLGANGYIIKAHFTPSEVSTKVKEVLAQ